MSAFGFTSSNSKPLPFTSGWMESHPGAVSSAEAVASYYQAHADSLAGRIEDFFGAGNKAQAAYYRTLANQEYETRATNSARAWDEYMASTQYQRAVKDLQAAGLNPWLALQSGLSSGSVGHTAGSGSSARYVSEESKKSGGSLSAIAMMLIACAKLFTALS